MLMLMLVLMLILMLVLILMLTLMWCWYRCWFWFDVGVGTDIDAAVGVILMLILVLSLAPSQAKPKACIRLRQASSKRVRGLVNARVRSRRALVECFCWMLLLDAPSRSRRRLYRAFWMPVSPVRRFECSRLLSVVKARIRHFQSSCWYQPLC